MYGYSSPYYDIMRWRDRDAQNDPNAMTPALPGLLEGGSPAGDTGGMVGGAMPAYQPLGGEGGSPAGDTGGTMGGGGSEAAKAGGWTKDQMSGGMAAAKGLGSAVNALTGGDQRPIQAPRIDDNSAGIRQQAAQMWQQVMQRKPRGLI